MSDNNFCRAIKRLFFCLLIPTDPNATDAGIWYHNMVLLESNLFRDAHYLQMKLMRTVEFPGQGFLQACYFQIAFEFQVLSRAIK